MTSVNVSEITSKSSFLQKQRDDTFEKLTKIFDSSVSESSMIKDLEALTSKRFGINLDINSNTETNITEFKLVDGTLEINDFEDVKLDLKSVEKEQAKAKKYNGDVDYKKLKIAGDLSDIVVKLDFNFDTTEDKAGLFLYCIGTAFVTLDNIHKLKLTNKLLADIELNDKEKATSEITKKLKELNSSITEEELIGIFDKDKKLNKVNYALFIGKVMKAVAVDFSKSKENAEAFVLSFTDTAKSYDDIMVSKARPDIITILRIIFGTVFLMLGLQLIMYGLLFTLTSPGVGIGLFLVGLCLAVSSFYILPENKAGFTSGATKVNDVINNLISVFPNGSVGKFSFNSELMNDISDLYSSGISSVKGYFSLEDNSVDNLNTGLLPNLSSRKVATEVIDFQQDDFGAKLEALVTTISTKITDGTYKDDYELKGEKEIFDLQELVEKRLGLKIKIITNGMLAAIMPFYSNKNHIFLNKFWRGDINIKDQDKLLKGFNNKEGSVDLQKAKLGGIFSEYVNDVYINFRVLIKEIKLSPAEITGIILHELGHGFYICEYSDRLESVNQVLANVATEVLGKKKKDLNYVYRELEKVNPNIKKEEVEVLLGDNRVVAGVKWFETIIGTVKYQLNVDTYDNSSFEQLADNFSSRFGYGRQTIIALDKLHKVMGSPDKSKTDIRVMQILSLISVIGGIALIGSLLVTAMPVGLLYAFLFGFLFRMSGTDMQDHTYDELKQRYIRLRNDSVELLKTDKLNKDIAKNVLEDIYIMDSVIKETYQWSTAFGKLANFVFSGARKSKTSIEEQMLLEELLSNDLFIAAAKLKFA